MPMGKRSTACRSQSYLRRAFPRGEKKEETARPVSFYVEAGEDHRSHEQGVLRQCDYDADIRFESSPARYHLGMARVSSE
jgi:hypothetical protein